MSKQIITSSATVRINPAGANSSPDGVLVQFTVTGTNSVVLKKNAAPPGAAQNLVNVAFRNASLVSQSAGTAITASGLAYVSAEDSSLDLYAVNTFTSGSVIVSVGGASLGQPGGAIPAGDVQPGRLGENTGGAPQYVIGNQVDHAGVTVRSPDLKYSGTYLLEDDAGGWAFFKDTDATSGADAGATLRISAVGDDGNNIDNPISIARAAGGAVSLARPLLGVNPAYGIGYGTGAGGAQTQATDKSTAVSSNTITTAITMNAANLAAATIVSFTFTNTSIAATDQVVVTHQSGGTSGAYTLNAFPAAGSAVISVRNNTAGGLAEAIVLRVSVYKAVSA